MDARAFAQLYFSAQEGPCASRSAGFTTALQQLQPFTSDKAAVKRAVSRTRAEGGTALFDAIARTAADISSARGKKALVGFTDGADNASMLNAANAGERARKVGVPLYTAAQGEALNHPVLMAQLRDLARRTGGKAYNVRNLNAAEEIFDDVARELQHTYFLTYRPPTGKAGWRQTEVRLKGSSEVSGEGKEGYDSN